MTAPALPPLILDAELVSLIERYRAAKVAGTVASRDATQVEKVGHYDKDMPMQKRTAVEIGPSAHERLAAFALADRVLQLIDDARKG